MMQHTKKKIVAQQMPKKTKPLHQQASA